MGVTLKQMVESMSGGWEPLDAITTVEQVAVELQKVMASWQKSEASEATCAARYADLLKKKKDLGAKIEGVKTAKLSEKVLAITKQIEVESLLQQHKSEIDGMVKAGVMESLHKVVATIMAVKRSAVWGAYSPMLQDPTDLDMLKKWIDAKVENKIKSHTEGANAKPYQEAFEAALQKYAGIVAPVAAPTVAVAAPAKKKKKAAVPVTTDLNPIEELRVFIPSHADIPVKMRGEQVLFVDQAIWEALGSYAASESEKASKSDTWWLSAASQHNFFATELMKGEATIDGRFSTPGSVIFSIETVGDKKVVVARSAV